MIIEHLMVRCSIFPKTINLIALKRVFSAINFHIQP